MNANTCAKPSGTLDRFVFRKGCLEEILARFAARDGLSFLQIANSVDLRKGLVAQGYQDIPKSGTGVAMKISKFAQGLVAKNKEEIGWCKQTIKPSIVFDEWTSCASKRFVNIVLLGDCNFWNLGLIRILGSATAQHCLSLVKERLRLYNVNFYNDIACIITDGCNVMKGIGTIIKPVHQQLCFAHAIQLAVVKTLYTEQVSSPSGMETNVAEDDEVYESDDDEGSGGIILEKEKPVRFNDVYGPLIKKVRATVSIFRRSPLKNEVLQKYSKSEIGKELKLIMDCKTRWNSLCVMLARCLEMKYCILFAQIELKINPLLSEDDFDKIKQICDVLEPTKKTVELLCRRDANLIKTDAALLFLLDHLQEMQTSVSVDLYTNLVSEIQARRTIASDALKYLHCGNIKSKIFQHLRIHTPSKRQAITFIISLASKFTDDLVEFMDEQEDEDIRDEEPAKKAKLDFSKAINLAFNESMQSKPADGQETNVSKHDEIATEVQLFEMNGKLHRGPNLEFVYKSLLSVTPTSVESERAFSAAGYLCNKFRSRLSDENLNNLLFLRAHFQKENQN